MNSYKKTGALDLFRLIAAFLIIAIHTSPLSSYDANLDFVLSRILARVAVPFFFMATGYFLYPHIEKVDRRYTINFCKRIGMIYAASILIYLPLNIYSGYFIKPISVIAIIKDILIDGTFYHLWYLPAILISVPLVSVLVRKVGIRTAFLISLVAYVIGLLGDSYYGLVEQLPLVKQIYQGIFSISEHTRNGLFFAPIYLMLGIGIYSGKRRISLYKCGAGLAISLILLTAEGLLLHILSLQRHDSMYLMLLPTMFFLFQILIQIKGRSSKSMRNIALMIYIFHPWMIVIVRGVAKGVGLTKLLVVNSLIHYFIVSLLSFLTAIIINSLLLRRIKPAVSKTGRAWVEIDLRALKHNAKVLQKRLPEQCRLMAVVKANAYGHGDIDIAKALNQSGIKAFAVATLEEGIHLRKKGIKGEILILGYTNPKDLECLNYYRLTQTVVDYAYAMTLNEQGKKIRVHVKLDTGMHRLGVDSDNVAQLEEIFQCRNLVIEGVYSHLSVSDSLKVEDVEYTCRQLIRFFDTVKLMKAKGYSIGKLHIQASYGILNYSDLPCDYARAGIALYGVLSNNDMNHEKENLKPVLALKARVAVVRRIEKGDCLSYGRQYAADKAMKIAIVTVGYADGIPRNLYQSSAYVLLHGQKASIIGRICMDQFIIDVTHIDLVDSSDIITVIGRDGNEVVRCEDMAENCGTISNDILSSLGTRLNHVIV